jgi:hypothetical protein
MPKEITHWAVARKAADRATDQHVRQIIKNNMSLYLAGAVMVDSPYYAFIGGDKNFFAKAGARLHGTGRENPFTAVLQVPAAFNGKSADQALAFTLGALTHIIADTVFHPMVYYLTGDYDDPDTAKRKKAVTLHRLLETWMDVWFARSAQLENGGSLLRYTIGARRGAKAFTALASSLFFGRGDMSAPARVAVVSHSIIQASFKRRWIAQMAGFYGRMARRDMGEFTALFYPQMTARPPSFFSEPIRYKNPFTGEALEESLEQMDQRATQACAEWFSSVAKNPDPAQLALTCQHLIVGTPVRIGSPSHFAPEAQRNELLNTLSVYKTAR